MQLFIMRHAKSDAGAVGCRDFDRPINERGVSDAKAIGAWMKQDRLSPDLMICSPALRALQTCNQVCTEINFDQDSIWWDKRLYLASLQTLLEILAETPDDYSSVMLTGHYPGMEELLTFLCGYDLPRTDDGALVTTATLAQIELNSFSGVAPESGNLINLIQPERLATIDL